MKNWRPCPARKATQAADGSEIHTPPKAGEKDAAADAEEDVVSAESIPSGRELVRTEEQIDGEILHHLIALGLSGFSQDEMRRPVCPAGTANPEALMEKAHRVLSSSDLRALLDGAEIEVEANYADSRGIFRPDLVVRKDGETWVGGLQERKHPRWKITRVSCAATPARWRRNGRRF